MRVLLGPIPNVSPFPSRGRTTQGQQIAIAFTPMGQAPDASRQERSVLVSRARDEVVDIELFSNYLSRAGRELVANLS